MSIMTIEDAPNVVSEDGLRMLVGQGYRLEVVCRATPERRHNAWYSKWIIRAVAADRSEEKLLVTSRSALKVREFKTLTGLVSFLQEFGFPVLSVPMEDGGRVLHALPENRTATPTG